MRIKILKIKDQKNGTSLIDIEYDKEFGDAVKKIYKRKRLSKKLLNQAVVDGLQNYLESKNDES